MPALATRTNRIPPRSCYAGVDWLKLLFAGVVVAIHTEPLAGRSLPVLSSFYAALTQLAVPFFFTASGFFVFRRFFALESEGLLHLKRRVRGVFGQFALWTALYLPLTLYEFWVKGLTPGQSAGRFLRKTLFFGENFLSWPIWYLLALGCSLGFAYLLLARGLTCSQVAAAGFAVYFTRALLHTALTHWGLLPPRLAAGWSWLTQNYPTDRWFAGLPYLLLGMMTARFMHRVPALLCAAVLLLAGAALPRLGGLSLEIATFLAIYALFQLSLQLPGGGRFAPVCRKASTVIYFTHMYFFAFFTLVLLRSYPHAGPDGFAFALGGSLLLSGLILLLQRRGWAKPVCRLFFSC